MISLPGIVLIDDDKDDLDTIQNSFVRMGYPCFPLQYQRDDPENRSGIDHVNLDMIKPRIVISDLNLQELQKLDEKQLAGPIATVLQKLPLNGPFILYFWSRNASTVEPVMKIIYERYKDIPYPIHWGVLDKAQFKSGQLDLKEQVATIMKESRVFEALCNWECRVSTAAQKTTDSLFSLARVPEPSSLDNFKDKTTEKLQAMLAVIGNEAIGIENAAADPDAAIELGLAPVLHDHISSIRNKGYSDFWRDSVPSIGTEIPLDKKVATKLNSFCHVEEVCSDYSKGCRGVFLELAADVLVDPNKRKKIESRFGASLDTIIDEEFLVQIAKERQRALVRNETKIGFVEISAECDQAQKKTKLHRYVFAALTPLKYTPEGEATFELYGKHNKKSHNGIYRVPDISLGEIDYMLQLSFKYQIGSLPHENSWLGNSLLRLRDQIMVDISFNCAQYISRPGIIAFK
ncbi:hypothetical protein [Vibrio metschnikovii]|uniref:hypothetical protein n=1 Tax=Vibrio metschnikovii TaxID=28172 RepID=UPI001C30EB0F|nr:hypothetical protein [Vibrio metschnikovii]